MTDQENLEDQTLDPEHAKRFLDLVRGALNTPVTDELKEEEREHEQAEEDRIKAAQKPGN